MAKIDEIKESLNSLRVWLSLSVGMIVVISGGVIARYDGNRIDLVFWSGAVLFFILLLAVALIIIKISKRTKEIGEL